MNRLSYTLPADLEVALHSALEDWQREGKLDRFWARDASLWSGSDEADWLGWLDIVQQSRQQLDEMEAVVRDLVDRGIKQVVLLGMGGSSMAPEVIADSQRIFITRRKLARFCNCSAMPSAMS